MKMYSMTKGSIEDTADLVKALVLGALVEEELLNDKVADQWCVDHTIIVREKWGFYRILGGSKKNDDGLWHTVVKRVASQSEPE